MAKPVHLKANTPGGNSYAKSVRKQKPVQGKAQPTPHPKVRAIAGKVAADANAAYNAGHSIMRPNILAAKTKDYASAWMQKHGLKNAQGAVPRLRYAAEPADQIGGGNSGSSRPAKKNPSGVTASKRVKATKTGRSYRTTSKSRVVKSK